MPNPRDAYLTHDINGLKKLFVEDLGECNSCSATGVANVASVEPLQATVDRGAVDAEFSGECRDVVAAVLERLTQCVVFAR